MIRDLIIERGFQFLAYHDTLGQGSSAIAHPENETRGTWILLGLFAVIVIAMIVFTKQNKQK